MSKEQGDIKKWLRGCRKGDLESQRLLYRHFYGYSMNICLRYSKNREDALEVMNNGWLKIFNKIDRFDMDLPFRPWCRRILINSALDYYRKIRTLPSFIDIDDVEEEHFYEMPMPVLLPGEKILPIVQKLPPAYRLVFNLYVMEEYKHHEIADLLGISIGTSKSNLARAKDKLRTLLSEERKKTKAN